ncbi:MAG: DUF3592 domain-containing protein [Pseudomonadota bacterium]
MPFLALTLCVSPSDWQVVDMQLLEVRLAEYSGEDSDTYEAIARYRYTLNGKTYENDRVWFGGGSDNIGSFQEDTYELLYEYYAEEEPYPGLVNPNDPNQSVLIKDMRWGMIAFVAIFPIIFGGVGGLLMFFALRMGNNQ